MTPFTISLGSFVTIFLLGLISGFSPCNLPTILFVSSYVCGKSSNSRKRGLYTSTAFSFGMIIVVTTLGILAGLTGSILNDSIIFQYITSGILIVMSLWLLDIIQLPLNGPLSKFHVKKGSGYLGAFLLGLPFGITSSPCTMPITFSLLALSANSGSTFWGGFLLLIFSIGKSIPILLVGTSMELLNKLKNFQRYEHITRTMCAILMILLSLTIIWKM